jgi:hypothetical protein
VQRVVLGAVTGLVLGTLVSLVVLVWLLREDLPLLTEDALAAAEARWADQGPADYDVDLRIEGTRGGTVHVEVRDREVVAMTRDGVTPEQRRTWYFWSVPGQFDTLREDLESAADPQQGFGAPSGTRAVLRAAFDPRFGYPRIYDRMLSGTALSVRWEVTRFEPIPAAQ